MALVPCMLWCKDWENVSLGQNVFVGNKVVIGDTKIRITLASMTMFN